MIFAGIYAPKCSLLCSVMYQRMARSSFIKVTLVVLSCSFLGKNTDDLSKNCQWCHHNFLCIVISSREGGRILPKKEKKRKNTYVAESMTFFIYNSVTCIIFRNKQKQLGSLGARRLSSIYLDVAQILTKLMTEL